MTTATAEQPTTAIAKTTDLPEAVTRRGINEAQWRTLANNLFPGADPQSVLMVVDYCQARKLDPLKKPCHIVPMRVKDARSGEWGWRDVVMPGIYEYRTTAQRTGLYLGRSRFEYGPEIEHLGVKAPQWCETTVYRHHSSGKIEFPVRRYFVEVVGTTEKNNVAKVNDRWARAPIQMLEKCTEAAALREAFPDEFGGEQTAEEIDGQHVIDVSSATEQIQPAQRLSQQTTTSTTTSTPAPSQAASATRVDGIPPQATSAPAGDAGAASGHGGNPTPAPTTTAPAPVGVIVEIRQQSGRASVRLDNGYGAGIKEGDTDTLRAAEMARDARVRVELVVKPPSDPAKFLPRILSIKSVTA
jgi:phage recombination protein Bet